MKMTRAWCGCLAALALVMVAGRVHAGPIELFNGAIVNPAQPMSVIAPYQYGGGGFFVSKDGGKNYGLMCTSAIDPITLQNSNPSMTLSAGSLWIGVFGALWHGSKEGCDWAQIPELMGRYVSVVTGDPLDPMRTYAATSDNPDMKGPNGLYVNDAAKGMTFTALGATSDHLINTLHVVKNGTARRFYETGVKLSTMAGTDPQYFVRVSDDEGKTWTDNEYKIDQFGPKDMYAEFDIMAIDPQLPDHVIGRVRRTSMVDTVLYSPMQGKAGTWVQLAEITAFDAVAFAPDGKLYIGDSDQTTKSLYVVEKPGDMPKKLTDTWKVGCLTYDTANKRMLGCHDFRFGSVDLTTGLFTNELDMRCAEHWNECPGKDAAAMHEVCGPQLQAAYCGLSHYPIAPVCAGYDQGPDAQTFYDSLDYTCKDGKTVTKPDDTGQAGSSAAGGAPAAGTMGTAGTPAAAGSGGVDHSAHGGAGQAAAAGSVAPSAGAAAPQPPKSGGCSVAAGDDNGLAWAFASLLALCSWRRRRQLQV
jgi:MYXO-CTERM domain-containing protein